MTQRQHESAEEKENMSAELPSTSCSDVGAASSPNETKVLYHVDDEATPYCTTVPVPADAITLADFKVVLNRSNYKFYCKSVDPDVGGEVKAEIRDDTAVLRRSENGRIELFLMTVEGSSHSDGSGARRAAMGTAAAMGQIMMNKAPPPGFLSAAKQFDQSAVGSTDSESQVSGLANLPKNNLRGVINRHAVQRQFLPPGHRRRFEDTTMTSESDARPYDSDDDRVSTSTDITSVSRQQQHHNNPYRPRRRNKRSRMGGYRQPSRASSISSITESSMSLNIITVILNMDTVRYLGISIVGQSSQRGDAGIYVANIMKGGAVALDGRIDTGDMILQVNEFSFENLTNDEAVAVLRDAVAKKGPIKLVVAKCFEGGGRSHFTLPRPKEEPVRPIDTHAWIMHTNAMRSHAMPSILEGSEGAPTPVPGQMAAFQHRAPSSGASNNSGSATQHQGHMERLDASMDPRDLVRAMSMPNSGLDIKDRTWLKIPIPMSFLGSALVDWLNERVDGFRERKDAKKYASKLLSGGYIKHVVNKITFTEQCYYVLGDLCADFARMRMNPGAEDVQQSEICGSIGPLPPPPQMSHSPWPMGPAAHSMVSGYASMPSPYPQIQQQQQQMQMPQQFGTLPTAPATPAMSGGAAVPQCAANNGPSGSQASAGSGNSSESSADKRARPPIPPKLQPCAPPTVPPGASAAVGMNDLPHDLAASRQSFRIAMNNPCEEFFIDNL